MPYGIYICPVVSYSIPDPEGGAADVGRGPKVRVMTEPGRTKNYQYSAAIDVGDWCLLLVRAQNFAAIDADTSIINLFEGTVAEAKAFLSETPRSLGWSAARLNRIRQRIEALGISTAGLTMDSTIETILNRIGQQIDPGFQVRHMRV